MIDILKYNLKIQKNAQKSLAKISEPFQTKIINKILALTDSAYFVNVFIFIPNNIHLG
jgi:mRNA-degrading endonuclease RelE of RelBE toxin-antitoxin system